MDRATYSSASATSDSAIKIGVKKLPCSHLIKGVGSPIAHSCPLLSACGRAGGRPAHRIASHRIVHPLRYICAIDRPRTTPPKCKRGAFCLPGSHFARRNACPVCFTISFPALRGLEAPMPYVSQLTNSQLSSPEPAGTKTPNQHRTIIDFRLAVSKHEAPCLLDSGWTVSHRQADRARARPTPPPAPTTHSNLTHRGRRRGSTIVSLRDRIREEALLVGTGRGESIESRFRSPIERKKRTSASQEEGGRARACPRENLFRSIERSEKRSKEC